MSAARHNPADFDPRLLAELRRLAETAARAGGEVARTAFSRPPGVRLKEDESVVTDADVAAQAAVVAEILRARPNDAWIGEEGPPNQNPLRQAGGQSPIPRQLESKVTWLIDPIDGTRNFVRGSPAFACSVGAMCDGMPIAGAIYEPLRDTMYSADAAGAVRVNDAPLQAFAMRQNRGPSGPAGELVVSLPSTATPPIAALMHACIDHCVIRNVGSAAINLAILATGQTDAAVLATCKLWDLAAGACLVLAGGGVFTAIDGRPLFPIDVEQRATQELPCIAARDAAVLERLQAFTRRP